MPQIPDGPNDATKAAALARKANEVRAATPLNRPNHTNDDTRLSQPRPSRRGVRGGQDLTDRTALEASAREKENLEALKETTNRVLFGDAPPATKAQQAKEARRLEQTGDKVEQDLQMREAKYGTILPERATPETSQAPFKKLPQSYENKVAYYRAQVDLHAASIKTRQANVANRNASDRKAQRLAEFRQVKSQINHQYSERGFRQLLGSAAVVVGSIIPGPVRAAFFGVGAYLFHKSHENTVNIRKLKPQRSDAYHHLRAEGHLADTATAEYRQAISLQANAQRAAAMTTATPQLPNKTANSSLTLEQDSLQRPPIA